MCMWNTQCVCVCVCVCVDGCWSLQLVLVSEPQRSSAATVCFAAKLYLYSQFDQVLSELEPSGNRSVSGVSIKAEYESILKDGIDLQIKFFSVFPCFISLLIQYITGLIVYEQASKHNTLIWTHVFIDGSRVRDHCLRKQFNIYKPETTKILARCPQDIFVETHDGHAARRHCMRRRFNIYKHETIKTFSNYVCRDNDSFFLWTLVDERQGVNKSERPLVTVFFRYETAG